MLVGRTNRREFIAAAPTTLVDFNGFNGANPRGGLIMDAAGNLFGTTSAGGQFGDGTVFEIAKTAAGYAGPITLHSFNGTDGAFPEGNLVADAKGNFGITEGGGANLGGTAFEIVGSGFDVGAAADKRQAATALRESASLNCI